jgi:hypothetical protein
MLCVGGEQTESVTISTADEDNESAFFRRELDNEREDQRLKKKHLLFSATETIISNCRYQWHLLGIFAVIIGK